MSSAFHVITTSELDALPTPIAVPAKRYADETDPRIKLALMIDTIETIYKYGSAIIVQTMRKRPDWKSFDSPAERSSRKSVTTMLRQPTLGEHIAIISQAFHHFRDRPQNPPSVLSAVTPLTMNFPREDILQLRNRRKGHGAWPDEAVAREWLAMGRDAFRKVLRIVTDLNQRFPLHLQAVPKPWRFSGPNPDMQGQLDQAKSEHRLVILDQAGALLCPLYPLFLYEKSGSVIYNGLHGGRTGGAPQEVTFLDYFSGDDVDRQPGHSVAADFRKEFLSEDATAIDDSFAFIGDRISTDSFTGRRDDLASLDAFVAQADSRMLLVHGVAGVGKTTLLARWSEEAGRRGLPLVKHQITENSPQADPRAIRLSLLRQLRVLAGQKNSTDATDDLRNYDERLASLLHAVPSDSPIVILVDGIDETAAFLQRAGHDSAALDWLPPEPGDWPHVRWILGLRTHFQKDRELQRLERTWGPAQHELKPFSEADTFSYLSRLLDTDHLQANRPLVTIAHAKSEGVPLYLHLLVQDIRAGRIAFTEGDLQKLSPGVKARWKDSLARLSAIVSRRALQAARSDYESSEREWRRLVSKGDLTEGTYQTRCAERKREIEQSGADTFQNLLALLAIAAEPITEDTIASLLDAEAPVVELCLSLTAAFLKEELEGFSCLHTSFREFLREDYPDWINRVSQRTADWCADPVRRLHGYTIRHGVRHLLAALDPVKPGPRPDQIAALLTDIDFITVKIRAGLVPELLQDYDLAQAAVPGWQGANMFDLDTDDEDRSWVVEARKAYLEGKPTPYPDRGGAGAYAAMQAALGAYDKRERKLSAARELFSGPTKADWMAQQLGGAFPPDYTTWPPDESETQHSRRCMQYGAAVSKIRAKARSLIAKELFRSESVTARTIGKITSTPSRKPFPDTGDFVAAFAGFVRESWRIIANEQTDTSSLAANFRNDGPIREFGVRQLQARQRNWVESLCRPDSGIQRLTLNLPDSGGYLRLFDGFKQGILFHVRDEKGTRTVVFQFFDVLRQSPCEKLVGETEIKPFVREPYPHHYLPNQTSISEDGKFVRIMEDLWELDRFAGQARKIDPNDFPEISADLGVPLPRPTNILQRDPEERGKREVYISSPDGVLGVSFNHNSGRLLNSQLKRPYLHMIASAHNEKVLEVLLLAEGVILLHRAPSGVVVTHLPTGISLLPFTECDCVAATRDGRFLATLSKLEVSVRDLATGRLLKKFSVSNERSGLQFSRSGELLYACGDIVDLRTGPVESPPEINDEWLRLHLGDSNRYWIENSIAHDLGANMQIRRSSVSLPESELFSRGRTKFFLLENDLLVTLDGDQAVFSTFETGGLAVELGWGPDYQMTYCRPDYCRSTKQLLLAATDGRLTLVNIEDRTTLWLVDVDEIKKLSETVGLQMLGRRNADPLIQEQLREENEQRRESGMEEESPPAEPLKFRVDAAVISHDGQWILTAGSWDALRFWNVKSGRCERVIPFPETGRPKAHLVSDLVISADGMDCFLIVWNGDVFCLPNWRSSEAQWTLFRRSPVQRDNWHFSIDRRHCGWVSHNRRFICLVGEYDDETTRREGVRALSEVLDLTNGTSCIIRDRQVVAGITPDGTYLFLHGPEEALRVVKTPNLEEVCRFPLPSGFEMMSEVMPDGRFVVQTKSGEQLRLRLHLPKDEESVGGNEYPDLIH